MNRKGADEDEDGPSAEERNVREVVETSLATEDLTPLLRLILDSDPGAGSGKATHASPSEAPVDPQQQFEERWAMVDLIQRCLEAVAEDQDRIIQDVCHSNATEISQCVSELRDMHSLVNDLQRLLIANNTKLQATGSALLNSAHSLSELMTVQGNVGAGIAAVAGTRELLQLCLDVGALLEQAQLYPALLLLERIRGTKLEPLLSELSASTSSPSGPQPSQGTLLGSMGGAATAVVSVSSPVRSKQSAGGHAAQSVSSLALKAYFQNLLSELTAAAKQLALSEFNSWLVLARMHAQRLGMRAIRRAAIDRQLDEDLARERRALLSMLEAGQEVREVASKLAVSAVRLELQKDGAPGPAPGVLQAQAGPQGPGQAGAGLAGAAPAAPGSALDSGQGQGGSSAKAATQLMQRVGSRLRERQRKIPVPALDDDDDGAEPAQSALLSAPKLEPVVHNGTTPAFIPEPDISTLHEGRPHLALKHVLAWQRQQVALQAGPGSSAARVGGAGLGAAPAASAAAATGSRPSGDTAGSGPSRKAQLALAVPASAMEGDAVPGLLHGFDLTGLLRCLHVHKVLGQLHKFREYYLEQRRLQVTNDLAPPAQFLEAYQPYLAQVTGFFVVESFMQRLFPELIAHEQVMFLWEGATSSLRTCLDMALESLRSATIMVLLKDFVMLMCLALTGCGFPTAVVQEVLNLNRPRYHDLLMASVAKEAAQAVERDPLTDGYQLLAEAHLREMRRLGLPLVLEGSEVLAEDLAPPVYAPFSQCVPGLLQQVRGFVRDSVSYLQGLFSPWELPQAIFHHRNKMITKVLVDVLQARINAAAAQGSLPACLRMVANIWALLQCLDTLDAWTLEQARPQQQQEGQEGAAGGKVQRQGAGGVTPLAGGTRSRKAAAAQDSVASNAQVALRATQDVAERAALRLIGQRVSKALDKLRAMPWLPPGPPPPTRSPYLEELVDTLQEVFQEAKQRLPRSSYLYLCRTITRSIGSAIIRLFTPEGAVKAYNLCAIQRLASDVAELQAVTAECGVPDLALEFAASAQLCSLLLSHKVDEVLVPELRKQRYPQLDTSVIITALDRYKELAKIGKDKTNFPTKRAMDNVAKQLRSQAGTSTRAIGDF